MSNDSIESVLLQAATAYWTRRYGAGSLTRPPGSATVANRRPRDRNRRPGDAL
jgi:hypothetical protein